MYLEPRTVLAAGAIAAVAAIAGVAGVTVAWLVLGVLNVALVAAVAADVATAPAPSALRPARRVPRTMTIGDVTSSVIRVSNPTSRVLRIAVRDAAPPSLHMTPLRQRAVVAARSFGEVEATITPARRGRIPMGPLTLRVGGRLGLGGRQGTMPDNGSILVYPALPGRMEAQLRYDRARVTQSGERSSAIRGGGTEFESLREYHPDDEFRRINWHATARAAKPISNVFREERNQHVLLLLDAGRMMAANVQGVSRFEWGIDAAMAVADLAARVGDHVGIASFARDLVALVPPRSSRQQPARILEALFAIEPTLDAPNYARVFASILSRWRRRSLLILVTELTDESAMEPLIDALPILLRRHLVTIASVTDPSLNDAAVAIPEDSEQVYRKAAAARAIATRERVASRLRGLGATVIDRPPGSLAGALTDSYLRAKATGRL